MKKTLITIFLLTFAVLAFGQKKTNKIIKKEPAKTGQHKINYPKFDFNNGPNPYINTFKDLVFFGFMRECFRETKAMEEISKVDVGNPFEYLDYKLYPVCDSIGKAFYKRIPPPVFCDECGTKKNYFLAQALHYYRSYELDSIAKSYLKKYGVDKDRVKME